MTDCEWQCVNCGHKKDGHLHSPPDVCLCGSTDFEPADVAAKREAENRAINAHDDYLEELRNG